MEGSVNPSAIFCAIVVLPSAFLCLVWIGFCAVVVNNQGGEHDSINDYFLVTYSKMDQNYHVAVMLSVFV